MYIYMLTCMPWLYMQPSGVTKYDNILVQRLNGNYKYGSWDLIPLQLPSGMASGPGDHKKHKDPASWSWGRGPETIGFVGTVGLSTPPNTR